jgi:hypothetical protein
MKRLVNVLPVVALAVVGILAAAAPVGAETLFTAVLNGLQEVPETPSTGLGTAVLILNDAQTEVSYEIQFSGLLGTQTAAHFHHAPPGLNGPVIFPLAVGSPISGTWAVTPADVAALSAMEVYVNVHTDLYPGGEIRGNICFAAIPTETTSWGQVKQLFR